MLTDIWSSIKGRTVAGDLGDRIRALPLVQRFRYLHTQAAPAISLELLPKLKASRQDWLASAPKGEASSVGWSPGLLAFKIRSAVGRSDVISSEIAAPARVSRAITPLSNQGPRRRVKSV
jgi:hypothetical protein